MLVSRSSNRRRFAVLLALAGFVAAACGHADAALAPPIAKVAFFEDLSVPDTLDSALPAALSVQAFLRAQADAGGTASFALETFDTQGDESRALDQARTVAADRSFVAAIVGPFWIEPQPVADVLGEAGVPVLNLSSAGRAPTAGGTWRSFVAPLAVTARAAASLAGAEAGSGPMCRGGDGTAWSRLVDAGLTTGSSASGLSELPADPSAAAAAAARVGCRAILWTGFAPGAQALRAALTSSVVVVGTDAMKTWPYLVGAPADTSSFDVCSCADVNTSTDPTAQVFINRYQVATGLNPGVDAVEGWDAAGILGRSLSGSGASRADVAQVLDRTRSDSGVGSTYRFDRRTPAPVRTFQGMGSRWIPS